MSLTLTLGMEASPRNALTPLLRRRWARLKLKPRPRSMRRAACFRPGRHPAFDVPGGGQALILGRLHRHRRPLAECAVEDDRLARPRELVNEAALADVVLKFAIWGVQRTRNGAAPLPLPLLAQVDQRDPRPPDEPLRLFSRKGPALA